MSPPSTSSLLLSTKGRDGFAVHHSVSDDKKPVDLRGHVENKSVG